MENAKLILEALLFASKTPMGFDDMQERLPPDCDIPALLEELRADYESRAFEIVERADRYSIQTRSEYAPYLSHEKLEEKELSRAAMEVMAVIAYHQPVTRTEIEDIRGVSTSKGSLDLLMEQGWIRPGPRREEPGRPVTWLTTPNFCEAFGLTSLKDLPGLDELREGGFIAANDVLPDNPTKQRELFAGE